MRTFLTSILLLAGITTASAQQAQPTLPTTELRAGMYLIRAEVARTEAQQQTGLMFRTQMAPNGGMLFTYPPGSQICMWMKNTLLPLSVAFLEPDGTIVNIADMQPKSLQSHCSAKPVAYALEMHQGWFRDKGIKPGMKISGLQK